MNYTMGLAVCADLNSKLVAGDTDVEGIVGSPALAFQLTLFDRAVVGEDLECRAPFFELHLGNNMIAAIAACIPSYRPPNSA